HLALQLRPLTADLLQTLAARLQLLLDARRDRQSLLGRELGPSDCITQRERKRECRHAGDRNPGEQPAPTSHQLRSSGGGVAPPPRWRASRIARPPALLRGPTRRAATTPGSG